MWIEGGRVAYNEISSGADDEEGGVPGVDAQSKLELIATRQINLLRWCRSVSMETEK